MKEQARLLNLLIEGIDYDRKAETISTTFLPGGIKATRRQPPKLFPSSLKNRFSVIARYQLKTRDGGIVGKMPRTNHTKTIEAGSGT